MKSHLEVYQFIHKSFQSQTGVMLLYVLESSGSSPGRQGFAMAVNANGEMEGSIGGGVMEHKFVELAKEKLNKEEQESSIRKQIHDKSVAKNQSGMICSGEQTIFLYSVRSKDDKAISEIIECLQEHRNGLLRLSPKGLQFLPQKIPLEDYVYWFVSENEWLYEEKIGYKNHLYLIGAGHCALAFSKIMRMMDFYIHLYDDRTDLNTFLANNYAHEKTVINNYYQLKDIIPSGDHHYVVVMTFGYRTDDLVVRALLHKHFKYFGLLGSSTKIEKMFNGYRGEGLDPNKLNRIYSPVGLQIHSQTPEEIAISIAAEIIKVKNEA